MYSEAELKFLIVFQDKEMNRVWSVIGNLMLNLKV